MPRDIFRDFRNHLPVERLPLDDFAVETIPGSGPVLVRPDKKEAEVVLELHEHFQRQIENALAVERIIVEGKATQTSLRRHRNLFLDDIRASQVIKAEVAGQ